MGPYAQVIWPRQKSAIGCLRHLSSGSERPQPANLTSSIEGKKWKFPVSAVLF